MPQVYLIGIGLGNPDTLTVRAKRLIEQSDCLIGAKRMLESAANDHAARHSTIKNEEIATIIASQPENSIVSVLLSGDVGFYSAAKKLTALLSCPVEMVCGISSLQYFCAKIGTSWDDMQVLSVHGREANVAAAVRKSGRLFVLTGSNCTAQEVCRQLCDQGLGEAQVWVGEELSYPTERITHATAKELCSSSFSTLAVMVIVSDAAPKTDGPMLGLEDSAFLRNTEGKTVPMTKQEVRAVALAKLRLREDGCVYDVGAGTGSVTVEAALTVRGGRVFAIEKEPQAVEQLRQNIDHFGLKNVTVVEGTAPDALNELPAPDFVFIGGSSGNLGEIIRLCLAKNARARVVVTAITLETLSQLLETVRQLRTQGEYTFDIVQLSAARARELGGGSMHLMTGQNPVYICTLAKQLPEE